jgi:hypothetical protein
MRQQTVHASPPGYGPSSTITERSLSKMRNDTAASGEFRINLPADVLAEARRSTSASPRAAMEVDGFRPGLFGRLIGLFTGRRR